MRCLFVCLLNFILFEGFSQNYFDVVNATYTNTFPNKFENSEASTTVEELAFELNFPVVLNDKTVLLTGLFANQTNLKLDVLASKEALNVIGLNVGINRTFNEALSATFMVFSKSAANVIRFSNNDMQWAFLSLFTNKKRSDLKYRYGIYANTEQYGLIIVPILGMYYVSKNKTFEANLNLPITGDINYKIAAKSWVGLRFDGLGTTYYLYNKMNNSSDAYVSKTSNELISYLRFQLSKSLYLNTKIGYAISRNYKVFDANDKIDFALTAFYFGDNRTQLNTRFKDGAVFKIELFYRLHFD